MAFLDDIDHLVLDLDGVVYVGADPVPGTAELAGEALARGKGLLFVTNTTRFSRAELAERIAATGIEASAEQVLHASRAVALHLRSEGLEQVLALGADALIDELTGAGIDATSTHSAPDGGMEAQALVVTLDEQLGVRDFNVLIRSYRPGMPLIAGHSDRAFPVDGGLHVGAGALALAVGYAVGANPTYVGKPEPLMFDEAERLLGGGRIALVGDSLKSDVAGANRAGWTSVWLRAPGIEPDGDARPDIEIADPRELL